MIYHVATADMKISLEAASHQDAAQKSLKVFLDEPGLCIVVSKKNLEKKNSSHEVYFLTENLTRPKFRIVE